MTDFSVWQQAPFEQVINHIQQRYHDMHRRQLDGLVELAQRVDSVHKGVFNPEVLPLLKNIQAELSNHMMKEERVLFPMIRQGVGSGAAMPISMMMHEHEEHDAAVRRLLELTENLQPPADACGSWQRLYAEAREFVNDLHDHIELENEVFFPRVLAS